LELLLAMAASLRGIHSTERYTHPGTRPGTMRAGGRPRTADSRDWSQAPASAMRPLGV